MAESKEYNAVDLLDIPDPQFIVKVGGNKHTYEPFSIIRKLENAGIDQANMDTGAVTKQIDVIRDVFEFNTPGADEKYAGKPALTANQSLHLLERFMAFLKELEVLKNLHALTQT